MRILFQALLYSLSLAILSGCGGSSSAPFVSDIQASQLAYGRTAQFTLTGSSLDKDLNVSTKNCRGLALVSGGSETSKAVTCTVVAVGAGAVTFEAKLADGTLIKSVSFDVPNPQVSMVTNLGTVLIELNPTAAPLTSNNFLQYVNDKFYDNTIIHRIVTSGIFIAQGGWLTPTPSAQAGQRPSIALEVGKGLSNIQGTIAMARTADPNSASSQYFFNLSDNTVLTRPMAGTRSLAK